MLSCIAQVIKTSVKELWVIYKQEAPTPKKKKAVVRSPALLVLTSVSRPLC